MRNTIQTVLAALAVVLSLAAAGRADTLPKPALDKDEVGRIVREYLLANPEIVEAALQALRTRRETEALARAETAIRKNAEALRAHPMSPVAGNPEGDVTVVEFFDYQCGFCKRALPTMTDLLESDRGVRVVWKEFPILGPVSRFMCAFREPIAEGSAHGFLVRYDKDCPIDERKQLYKESKRQMRAFARARNLEGMNREELGFEMIRTALRAEGLPEHGWLRHPLPTRQEPNKEVRWITEHPDTDLDDKARLYLGASLGRVDNVFQLTRRFLSPLERPFYTPSGGWNQVWYGYAPYNPDMVKKYLDIFRAVNNFVHTGRKDGATPAMRLGFTPLATTSQVARLSLAVAVTVTALAASTLAV